MFSTGPVGLFRRARRAVQRGGDGRARLRARCSKLCACYSELCARYSELCAHCSKLCVHIAPNFVHLALNFVRITLNFVAHYSELCGASPPMAAESPLQREFGSTALRRCADGVACMACAQWKNCITNIIFIIMLVTITSHNTIIIIIILIIINNASKASGDLGFGRLSSQTGRPPGPTPTSPKTWRCPRRCPSKALYYLSLSLSISLSLYIYIYTCMCVYIYIYIERERDVYMLCMCILVNVISCYVIIYRIAVYMMT